jgi:hypothetical protein
MAYWRRSRNDDARDEPGERLALLSTTLLAPSETPAGAENLRLDPVELQRKNTSLVMRARLAAKNSSPLTTGIPLPKALQATAEVGAERVLPPATHGSTGRRLSGLQGLPRRQINSPPTRGLGDRFSWCRTAWSLRCCEGHVRTTIYTYTFRSTDPGSPASARAPRSRRINSPLADGSGRRFSPGARAGAADARMRAT